MDRLDDVSYLFSEYLMSSEVVCSLTVTRMTNRYNWDLGAVLVTHLTVELPTTGGALPDQEVVQFALPRRRIDALVICELLLFLLNIIGLARELDGLCADFHAYFNDGWNLGDLSTQLLIVAWCIFRVMFYYDALRFDASLDALEYYGQFQSLAFMSKTSRQIIAISVIISWLKIQKYAQLLPMVGPMMTAAMTTLFDIRVKVFAGLFISIIFVFSLGCHVAFGTAIGDFSTILQRCGHI